MAEITKDMKRMLFQRGAKQRLWLCFAFTLTSWACAIVGIVSDVIDETLGLEPTNWFIGSVAFLIASAWHWFMAYYAAKEG